MCNRKAILVLVVSAGECLSYINICPSKTCIHLSAFSCGATSEKLPEEYSPYTLCSGIVDYDFYVPEGSSLGIMKVLFHGHN